MNSLHDKQKITKLDTRSVYLRKLVVRILEAGRRGHLGSALSLIEILRVLYDDILHVRPDEPMWYERDRCILSKGHGCLALYAVLADKGFFPEAELWKFCKEDGILGGHPDYGKIPGVEASTGALGHGLPISVGYALSARFDGSDRRVFVVLGDGECNEGSVWEAALSAGNRRLSNLCIMIDYNKQQSYDTTFKVQNLEPLADKWRSFNCAVEEVDGHDVKALREKLGRFPFSPDRPSVLICHTVKGKGIGFAEDDLSWHHKSKLSDEDIRAMYAALEELE